MNLGVASVLNKRVVFFVMLLILVGGIWSYEQIGRLEDPEFTIKEALDCHPLPRGQRGGGRQGGQQPDRKRLSAARPAKARGVGVHARSVGRERHNPGRYHGTGFHRFGTNFAARSTTSNPVCRLRCAARRW